jgi:hypothetical protein
LIIAEKGYDTIARHAVKQMPSIKNATTKIVNNVSSIRFQNPVMPMSNSIFSLIPEL